MKPCKWVKNKSQECPPSLEKLMNDVGIVEFCEGVRGKHTKINLKGIYPCFLIQEGYQNQRIDVGEIVKFYYEHRFGKEVSLEAYEIFTDNKKDNVKYRWISSDSKYVFIDEE